MPKRPAFPVRRSAACFFALLGLLLAAALPICVLPCRAQQSPTPAGNEAARPPYAIVREEEDWSFLRDPARRKDEPKDEWDAVKYVPFHGGYVSFGGQYRPFYENIENEGWGTSPVKHNNYILHRFMLHADVHADPSFRTFVELKAASIGGRTGGARPPDRDDLDVNQAFLEWHAPAAAGHPARLALRAGRQELDFGAERQISVREGPNVRQGFDGLFAVVHAGAWRVDGFLTRPAQTKPRSFDDGTDYTQALSGIYATGPLSAAGPAGPNLDLYLFRQRRRDAPYSQGVANETRNTVGGRFWGRSGPFDYDAEPSFQFGRFGGGDIRAWGVGGSFGYSPPRNPYSLRVALIGGVNSGDQNAKNPGLQTFSPPAPSGRYFGQIPSLGPQNTAGFAPTVGFQPVPRVSATLGSYFFWRESLNDGVYGLGGGPLRAGENSRAAYIGAQPELNVAWQMDRHATLYLDYAQFSAGSYLHQTPPGKDIRYFGGWLTYLF